MSCWPLAALAQQVLPFTVQDLVSLYRLSDPQISPDGRHVAYVLRETDLEANKGRTDLWLIDLAAKASAAARLTQNPANDAALAGRRTAQALYFLSTRSGSSQVWRLALAGGEPTQVTDYPLDVGSFKVSPSGDRLALTMEVLPGLRRSRLHEIEARDAGREQGHRPLYERMFMRHWDTWSNGTRSQLFVATLGRTAKPARRCLSPARSMRTCPPSRSAATRNSRSARMAAHVVFSARAAGREESWSTNFDLYEVSRGRRRRSPRI